MEKNRTSIEKPRNERKYLIKGLCRDQVEWIVKLHPAVFSEIFQERFVNSVYLDSFEVDNYHDSLAGSSDRLKVRVRWYGDLFGQIAAPVLEFKTKKGLVGHKERFPLVPFVFEKGRSLESIADSFRRSSIPARTQLHLMSLQPSLLSRYRRKYFQSADQRFRITVDSDLECYQLRSGDSAFFRPSFQASQTVLELKYDPEADDDARWISNRFPFRMTKNSKYVSGLGRLRY